MTPIRARRSTSGMPRLSAGVDARLITAISVRATNGQIDGADRTCDQFSTR